MWFKHADGAEPAETEDQDKLRQLFAAELAVAESRLRETLAAELEADYELRASDWEEKCARRYNARLADYQQDCESDFDERLKRRVGEIRRGLEEEVVEDLERAKAEADSWQQRAVMAATCVAELVTAIMPREERQYALGRHCRISTLPLRLINDIMKPTGQVVIAETTDSTHGVEVESVHGKRTFMLFSRSKISPQGVVASAPEAEQAAPDPA